MDEQLTAIYFFSLFLFGYYGFLYMLFTEFWACGIC